MCSNLASIIVHKLMRHQSNKVTQGRGGGPVDPDGQASGAGGKGWLQQPPPAPQSSAKAITKPVKSGKAEAKANGVNALLQEILAVRPAASRTHLPGEATGTSTTHNANITNGTNTASTVNEPPPSDPVGGEVGCVGLSGPKCGGATSNTSTGVSAPASPPAVPEPTAAPASISKGKRQELKAAYKQRADYRQAVRVRRLMKELRDIRRREAAGESSFSVSVADEDVYEWDVKLRDIDEDSQLSADMRAHGIDTIELHLSFPDAYPFAPPFMFVKSPRIENGFILDGGAICLELLTSHGWVSSYTVQAIILQFASSLSKGSGRLSKRQKGLPFTRKAAEQAFQELVVTHEKYGWVSPPKSEG